MFIIMLLLTIGRSHVEFRRCDLSGGIVRQQFAPDCSVWTSGRGVGTVARRHNRRLGGQKPTTQR